LCELVLVSPGRRIGREAACEALFPHLGSAAATNELRKALSMARTALSALGEPAAGLLMADRAFIQAQNSRGLEVDFEAHEEALRLALSMPPGQGRDDNLALALEEEGTLLEDEPYAEWALGPR
jgi:DNA-binding SARP family transcriptional activator